MKIEKFIWKRQNRKNLPQNQNIFSKNGEIWNASLPQGDGRPCLYRHGTADSLQCEGAVFGRESVHQSISKSAWDIIYINDLKKLKSDVFSCLCLQRDQFRTVAWCSQSQIFQARSCSSLTANERQTVLRRSWTMAHPLLVLSQRRPHDKTYSGLNVGLNVAVQFQRVESGWLCVCNGCFYEVRLWALNLVGINLDLFSDSFCVGLYYF